MIPAFNEASAPRRLIQLLTMATLLSFAVPAAAAFATSDTFAKGF